MNPSSLSKYLKIYLWQGISFILSFISMFIVMPFLTSNATVFGIYSVCVSFNIFLAYTDLGFLGAAQKYTSEYYIRNERENEIKMLGFVGFILTIFLSILSLLFLYFSFYPEIIIKNIVDNQHKIVAVSLLRAQALFTLIFVFQRLLQTIFLIRLEDFIIQRCFIVANIIRIISVMYFFRNGSYLIVEYYYFSQFVTFFAVLYATYLAKKKYNYDFLLLLKSFKWDNHYYRITKKLAFSSLFLTVCWIIYYESDTIAISKILGVNAVAIYVIGLTLLSFFRSILGIIFSPFNTSLNYYVGLSDFQGLEILFQKIIRFSAPVVVFPIIVLIAMASTFVSTWVGIQYHDSILIVQLLVSCNLFAFIAYPTSYFIIATEDIKALYYVSSMNVFIVWGLIALLLPYFGVTAFAIAKLVAFFANFTFCIIYINKKTTLHPHATSFAITLFLFALGAFFISFYVSQYLPVEKSKLNFLQTFLVYIIITSTFMSAYVVFDKELRLWIFSKIKNRKLAK